MTLADITQIASAVAALGALGIAIWQLWRLRSEDIDRRVSEIEGVAVDTTVIVRPRSAHLQGGRSLWKYEFTVNNPGRFPITDVNVRIEFPFEVQRLHHDGVMDKESPKLDMHTPVIPAGADKSWRRKVILDHEQHERLRETIATVTFQTPDAGLRTTIWPSSPHGRKNQALVRRISKA